MSDDRCLDPLGIVESNRWVIEARLICRLVDCKLAGFPAPRSQALLENEDNLIRTSEMDHLAGRVGV